MDQLDTDLGMDPFALASRVILTSFQRETNHMSTHPKALRPCTSFILFISAQPDDLIALQLIFILREHIERDAHSTSRLHCDA